MTDESELTDEIAAQHDDQTADATDASTLSRHAALAGLFGLETGTPRLPSSQSTEPTA